MLKYFLDHDHFLYIYIFLRVQRARRAEVGCTIVEVKLCDTARYFHWQRVLCSFPLFPHFPLFHWFLPAEAPTLHFSSHLTLGWAYERTWEKTEKERERERVSKNEVIARESKGQRAAHSTFYRCLLLPELVELQCIYKTCHSTNFSLQMCKYLYLYSTYIFIAEIRKQIFFLLYIATSSVNQWITLCTSETNLNDYY